MVLNLMKIGEHLWAVFEESDLWRFALHQDGEVIIRWEISKALVGSTYEEMIKNMSFLQETTGRIRR